METLAVGAFLTALAVQLGAPNWMIGALAAIPHLAQIAQLPALWTVEQLRKRRRIYLISGAVARPMLLVIAVATVALPANIALWTILAAFSVRYVAGAFLSCAWNSWMRDLVPDNEMGRLFSDRQRKMIGVGLIFSLLAAAFVDAWKQFVPLAPEMSARTWEIVRREHLQRDDLAALQDVTDLTTLGRRALIGFLGHITDPLAMLEKEIPGLTVADVLDAHKLPDDPGYRADVVDVLRRYFLDYLKRW